MKGISFKRSHKNLHLHQPHNLLHSIWSSPLFLHRNLSHWNILFYMYMSLYIVMDFSCCTLIEGKTLVSSNHSLSMSSTNLQNNEDKLNSSIQPINVNNNSLFLPRNEGLRYRVAVWLAKEEAKCLEEFGIQENRITLEYETFIPFKCGRGENDISPSRFDNCEMCRSLTQNLRRSKADCESFCGQNNFCLSRCESIRQRSQSFVENVVGNENEMIDSGYTEMEKVKNSSFETKVLFDNKNALFMLEEPKVFCEDVIAMSESHNVDNGDESFSSSKMIQFDVKVNEPFYPFRNTAEVVRSSSSGSHFLYLKWRLKRRIHDNSMKIRHNNNLPENGTVSQSQSQLGNEITLPIVFVLEYQTPEDESWLLVGKKYTNVERLHVPYHAQKYRWRITAVGPNGIIDRAYSINFISTLDGFIEPGPPTRIFVAKEFINEASVDVLIGWEPPSERPCAYKINLYPMDTLEHYRTHRLTEPLGENLHLLKGLRFGAKYDVTMTSRGDNWRFESTLKSQNFTTITCLEAHNHRFDKCDPLPPRNITHQLLQNKNVNQLQSEEKKGKLSIKLSWLPPLYTSNTNPIINYTVSLGPPLNDSSANHKDILSAAYFRMNRNYNLPGNTTHIFLNEFLPNTQYVIKLIAVSVKGKSQPVQYHLSTKLGKEEIIMTQTSNWLILSASICFLIITLFGCHFIRVYLRKRKVKKARNEYFQTMEERDGISADWSIVPLNEDYHSLKLLGDYPKDKWEISYDKLILGDVIGQGAFGIVRRATIARKYVQEWGKAQHENTNTGSDQMETVAVKMLKLSATRDDKDQLIKEIITMQNLGCHAQIVSLLGACTKGRSLCLILEYCPGGDLLTFLRKVRGKYWPTLGLSETRKSETESGQSCNSKPSNTRGSTSTSISSHRKSTDSTPINYADIETFSDYSASSPDKPCPSTHPEYGNTPPLPGVDVDEYCRPIDEKDVLSYARQVAMGMEYLEKNHIVHRDLAGRNVLLLGDYRQVKLSDFGLSRDVYTWNVYHQKSNGKLPVKWMAIESIFTHVFTSKSDVWSYGILLWELVTLGGTPYPGLANTELFQVLKSGYRMERPDNCSEELFALMKKCWRTAPGSRPNFTELRNHVETMMEAAEPSLYLSLMADLPTDYFRINTRNDLISTTLDDEPNLSNGNSTMNTSNSSSHLKQLGSNNVNTNHKRKALKEEKKYPNINNNNDTSHCKHNSSSSTTQQTNNPNNALRNSHSNDNKFIENSPKPTQHYEQCCNSTTSKEALMMPRSKSNIIISNKHEISPSNNSTNTKSGTSSTLEFPNSSNHGCSSSCKQHQHLLSDTFSAKTSTNSPKSSITEKTHLPDTEDKSPLCHLRMIDENSKLHETSNDTICDPENPGDADLNYPKEEYNRQLDDDECFVSKSVRKSSLGNSFTIIMDSHKHSQSHNNNNDEIVTPAKNIYQLSHKSRSCSLDGNNTRPALTSNGFKKINNVTIIENKTYDLV